MKVRSFTLPSLVSLLLTFALPLSANAQAPPPTTTIVPNRDFTTETVTWHGLRLIMTVPGLGVVLLDAGTFVIDAAGTPVFEAGPHQLLHGEVAQFCAAMSS